MQTAIGNEGGLRRSRTRSLEAAAARYGEISKCIAATAGTDAVSGRLIRTIVITAIRMLLACCAGRTAIVVGAKLHFFKDHGRGDGCRRWHEQ
jgi:hypothetical protein